MNHAGVPLCLIDEYRENPHSWVKLWKHHAAEPQAKRLNVLAARRGERFLSRYGGSISPEWLLPKLLETAELAPSVFEAADIFIEAADWVVWQLCGELTRNSCCAGYKGMWHKTEGYPSDDFLKELHPKRPFKQWGKSRSEVISPIRQRRKPMIGCITIFMLYSLYLAGVMGHYLES
ncbi:hypothetical protein DQG13_03710 [Paenibacillus sp. YN15]|nr:hypothetical protein DQG13_03710 [Paenibacillus sp. YN15]